MKRPTKEEERAMYAACNAAMAILRERESCPIFRMKRLVQACSVEQAMVANWRTIRKIQRPRPW